jgi:acyl-CoA synthetase (AMP-forming)/AMP-acid ligase II
VLARHDEDGYVWIIDRVADSFVSEGQLVYPSDVERVLARHPGVDDAGVLHVAHSGGGPAVAAFVVPSAGSPPSEVDILDFARRHLPAHQAPTFSDVPAPPATELVGKLQRP